MTKKLQWFVWLTKSGAALGDRLKAEAGYKGRDELVHDALSLLVSIRSGNGVPYVVEKAKERRQKRLAERGEAK